MKIDTIDTGYFYADGGAMFGAIPKSSWSRRYPCNAQNACVLAMRTLLIEADGRIILVDNGAGYKHLKTLGYYQFFNLHDLHEALT
ncbi:MAG: MBL fold metallo-hydrolase, partial [Parabacteroides sp.]